MLLLWSEEVLLSIDIIFMKIVYKSICVYIVRLSFYFEVSKTCLKNYNISTLCM